MKQWTCSKKKTKKKHLDLESYSMQKKEAGYSARRAQDSLLTTSQELGGVIVTAWEKQRILSGKLTNC